MKLAEHISQMKVLVLDDQPMMQIMLRQVLKECGFNNISITEKASQAQALLQKQKFDLVLLDLNLPESSGLEVLAHIRHTQNHHGLPVIIVSAEGNRESIVACLEGGADDFIVKPFAFKTMQEKILRLLTKKPLRSHRASP